MTVNDHMHIEREVVGRFIDASVDDHAEAKRLLDAHPQLRDATWLGDERLLSFLVIENGVEGVRFCLENGFDPNHRDRHFGTTPLHKACQLNYFDVAQELLKHGADPDAHSDVVDTPIHCCIQNGNYKLLDLLLANGADPNYMTDLGETIFDNWPNDAEKQAQLASVLRKHNIERSVR